MYVIDTPRPHDARDVGPVQLACWHETYLNPELGIDDAWIDEHIGFVDTPESVTFRQNLFAQAEARPDRMLYRVVRSGDEITGFLHGERRDDGTVELAAIYLRDSLKGQGAAAELMQIFTSWAGDSDWRLSVVGYNERAVRFYARYGFTLTGERSLEWGTLPVVVMHRPAGAVTAVGVPAPDAVHRQTRTAAAAAESPQRR